MGIWVGMMCDMPLALVWEEIGASMVPGRKGNRKKDNANAKGIRKKYIETRGRPTLCSSGTKQRGSVGPLFLPGKPRTASPRMRLVWARSMLWEQELVRRSHTYSSGGDLSV